MTLTTKPADPLAAAFAAAGWIHTETGGGCQAYGTDWRAPTNYFLATDADDPGALPTWSDNVVVCEYMAENDLGTWHNEPLNEWTLSFVADRGDGIPGYVIDSIGMAIFDPFASECGRFVVDPAIYGIPPMLARALAALQGAANELGCDAFVAAADAARAADADLIRGAIDAMFAHVQTALGVTTGDYAASVWEGSPESGGLEGFLRAYIRAERANVARGAYK